MGNPYRLEDIFQVAQVYLEGAYATGNHRLGVVIPDNAIIVNVIEDVIDLTGTTDDTGTIELTLGDGGTSITAANAMPTAGITESVKSATGLGTKTTAGTELYVTITTRAMASGRVRYFVEYVLGIK